MFHLVPVLLLATPTPISAPSPFGYLALISEIRIDQPGADTDEFLEIHTPFGPTTLEHMSYVVLGDGAGGSGTIEAAFDLSIYTTGADGYLTIAEGTFGLGTADVILPLDFENGDNVTHLLVSNFSGAVGDDVDLDDDGVIDSPAWLGIFDGIGVIETLTPDLGGGEEHEYATSLGLPVVGPDGAVAPGHIKLCSDARGGMAIASFVTGVDDTPGAPSTFCPPPTTGFCSPPEPNEFGPGGGIISVEGSFSIAANDNELVASDLPNTFGVFVQANNSMSPMVAAIGGNICLSGSLRRMNEIVTIASNTATLTLDFTDGTRIESSIFMGDTRFYQFFYRDSSFVGGGNFTDGIEVTWEE